MIFSSIPRSEFQDRFARLRALLVKEGYEAIIVYSTNNLPGNVQYFSNFASMFSYGTHSVIFLASPKHQTPTLLFDSVMDHTTAAAAKAHGDEVLADWDIRLVPDYSMAIAGYLNQIHAQGKVGVADMGLMPALLYKRLTAANPKTRFEEAQHLVDELRIIKSSRELAMLRKSAAIADIGIEAGLNTIQDGTSEHAVAVAADHGMRTEGAETFLFPTCVGAGLRANLIEIIPGATNAVIKNGDLVILDVGARCDGYCSDISRTKVCGNQPTKKQRDLYEVVKQAYQASFDSIRPGVTFHEIHDVAERVMREAGYTLVPPIGGGPIGHGVGLEAADPPRRQDFLPEGDKITAHVLRIAPNMVFTLEPGIYLPDFGGVRLEDTVLATEAGAETLTRSPMDIV